MRSTRSQTKESRKSDDSCGDKSCFVMLEENVSMLSDDLEKTCIIPKVVSEDIYIKESSNFVNLCTSVNISVNNIEKTTIVSDDSSNDIVTSSSDIYDYENDDNPDNFCGFCNVNFYLKESHCIECEKCKKWFHMECVNLSLKQYNVITQVTNCTKDAPLYCCPGCIDNEYCETNLCSDATEEKKRTAPHRTGACEVFLPPPDTTSSSIAQAKWGKLRGAEIADSVNNIYTTVIKWKKNLFAVPTGKVGQEFIDEVSKTINLFTSGSHFEEIALTMVMIMFPLLLQKPSRSSKSKDHVQYLSNRLAMWRSGELQKLVKECLTIQRRMKAPKNDPGHHEKVFVRLMLQGKVSAALKWNGRQRSGLMEASPEVIDILKSKHPQPGATLDGSMLKGPVQEVDNVTFDALDGNLIHHVAKKISGAAGPSGADAELWQRILCSKQFKKKPEKLCESVADLAKKLACKLVNPDYLKSYTAGRLIPLAKNPDGVRPIGVGEVLRRIIGRAVTTILQPDLVNSTAPLQVCGGLRGGVEAAIHAMRRMYEDPETEAILLVDAENAFNSLNRAAALNNLQYTCPEFFKYVLNTYRIPAELYIANSEEMIYSEEGTTQGDTSAMGMYACSLMPLAESLRKVDHEDHAAHNPRKANYPKQVFYADDAAAAGKVRSILLWWEDLKELGPQYGYYPNPSKSWLIVKPAYYEEAKKLFPDVHVTDKGHRYLGSYIGSEEGLPDFINNEIKSWNEDIVGLSKIARSEPQLAYAAFIFGTSKRWNYVARTTPGISELLRPLEYQIKENFIPAIIGKQFVPDNLRELFSLPSKMGGLGITNIAETAQLEYTNSLHATSSLTEAVYRQHSTFMPDVHAQKEVMKDIKKCREEHFQKKKNNILERSPATVVRQLELLSEKGASCWLTSLPLKDYGFLLNKQEFFDSIALRYNLTLSDLDRPKVCACGEINNINHCMICKLGGYVIMRHDALKRKTADIMQSAGCKDVQVEPGLLNITTE